MGPATAVTMTGGNVAHSGPAFGDEDDMLFLSLEFGNNTYAICEYGSAFHYSEHYVLIQGTEGYIRIDMKDTAMTVFSVKNGLETFTVHESQEEDDDRTRIYYGAAMDGAIMYGHPGVIPPLWLRSIIKKEVSFFNSMLDGEAIPAEYCDLLNGKAARDAIATADAATRSLRENRKVLISEITG